MKILMLYDSSIAHTTGNYVFDELISLGHQVERVNPRTQISEKQHSGTYDFLLSVDYGVDFEIPRGIDYKKSAIWIIDTHLHFARYFNMAIRYDYIFCAQKKAFDKIKFLGIANVQWLPLACSIEHHGKRQAKKIYDIAFIGSLTWGARRRILEKIRADINPCFIGSCEHEKIGEIYSRAQLVLNISINDDLNMRYFEAQCAGTYLMTDLVYGIPENYRKNNVMFYEKKELKSPEIFIEKIKNIINNIKNIEFDYDEYNNFLNTNNYLSRSKSILNTVESNKIIKRPFLLNKTTNKTIVKIIALIFFPKQTYDEFIIKVIRKMERLKNEF